MELLIVIGVILGAALVIVLLLCLTRLFTGLARNSKAPLAYLSILLLCYGVVTIASQLPLLRPDLVFPNRWLVPDPDNLMSLIVVQAMVYLGLLTILPALTAVAIILLMLVPFMHKIIWPLLWKPLDQLNRKLHNTSGLLMSGGVALIAIAWPGSTVLNVLEKIHSLL